MKLWPWFRKKSAIYQSSSYFGSFGVQNVTYKQIYTAAQDNTLLIKYFNEVAEVAAPVLKYHDGANQVAFTTENKEVQKLLDNPNYYQGWNEFFAQLILYKRLLGNSIVDAFATTKLGESKKPESLFNLSSQFTAIQTLQEKDFRFNSIEKYIFDSQEADKDALIISPEFIMHLKDANPNFTTNQYLWGESRYAGTYRNIESIIEGYSAKVNLYKNDIRLIITGKSQGDFAAMADTENISVVQDAMKKYGSTEGKYPNIVTDVPLDVTQAGLNVAQMQILENNSSDFDRLCDAQSVNSKIFSKDTKFEDAKSALSDFYNNAFRSEIDSTFNDLQAYLQRWWPELDDLKPDYSQISEIVEANNEENQRLLEDTEKGLMTRNEYLLQTGKEERQEKEFNELYFLTGNGWIPLTNNITDGTEANQTI